VFLESAVIGDVAAICSLLLSTENTSPTTATSSSASLALTLEAAVLPETIIEHSAINVVNSTVLVGSHHSRHETFIRSVGCD
jgi:hypothetical protein